MTGMLQRVLRPQRVLPVISIACLCINELWLQEDALFCLYWLWRLLKKVGLNERVGCIGLHQLELLLCLTKRCRSAVNETAADILWILRVLSLITYHDWLILELLVARRTMDC